MRCRTGTYILCETHKINTLITGKPDFRLIDLFCWYKSHFIACECDKQLYASNPNSQRVWYIVMRCSMLWHIYAGSTSCCLGERDVYSFVMDYQSRKPIRYEKLAHSKDREKKIKEKLTCSHLETKWPTFLFVWKWRKKMFVEQMPAALNVKNKHWGDFLCRK